MTDLKIVDQPLVDVDEAYTLRGLASLMTRAFRGEDLTDLGNQLVRYANSHGGASCANAMMDLSILLHLRGQYDTAMSVQAEALKLRQVYRLPAGGTPAIRLLAFMTPGDLGANTPLEFIVENTDIELTMLYVDPSLPLPEEVPDHDVAFVAIGEAGSVQPALRLVEQLAALWPRPVLNAPERIAPLSRERASKMLQALPGVEIPNSVCLPRERVERIARGAEPLTDVLGDGDFPTIVRPRDSHAGKGLDKADDPAQLAAYLRTRPEAEFVLARFVDYRSPDGQFRKYRVVLIDGRPYASHMVISDDWVVHYVSGGMPEDAYKREEEARFMAEFDTAFARRHAAALDAIAECVRLDYLVVDCAEMPDGRLLVFEVHNAAVVHAMDPIEIFPYKHTQMRTVFDAFRAMLVEARERGRNVPEHRDVDGADRKG